LPPTIDEIDAFLGDNTPQSYEKVVDRLLEAINVRRALCAMVA
jgi:hypothetical protein